MGEAKREKACIFATAEKRRRQAGVLREKRKIEKNDLLIPPTFSRAQSQPSPGRPSANHRGALSGAPPRRAIFEIYFGAGPLRENFPKLLQENFPPRFAKTPKNDSLPSRNKRIPTYAFGTPFFFNRKRALYEQIPFCTPVHKNV
jgi:hypothetical protein